MTFSFVPLAVTTVFFVSAGISCLFAALLKKITHVDLGSYRITLAFLFLSAAVITAAVMIITVPLPKNFSHFDAIFYSILFFLVFLSFLFFRSFGLILLLLYLAYISAVSFSLVTGANSAQKTFELEVTDSFINVNNINQQKISIQNHVQAKNITIDFKILSLPQSLLLPIKSQWYYCSSISAGIDFLPLYTLNKPLPLFLQGIDFVTRNFLIHLANNQAQPPFISELAITIPETQFYPAIYSVQINKNNQGNFSAITTRLF